MESVKQVFFARWQAALEADSPALWDELAMMCHGAAMVLPMEAADDYTDLCRIAWAHIELIREEEYKEAA